jgi:hypothetical protein
MIYQVVHFFVFNKWIILGNKYVSRMTWAAPTYNSILIEHLHNKHILKLPGQLLFYAKWQTEMELSSAYYLIECSEFGNLALHRYRSPRNLVSPFNFKLKPSNLIKGDECRDCLGFLKWTISYLSEFNLSRWSFSHDPNRELLILAMANSFSVVSALIKQFESSA